MSEVWYECKIRPDLKRFSFVNQYELFSHPSYYSQLSRVGRISRSLIDRRRSIIFQREYIEEIDGLPGSCTRSSLVTVPISPI